VLFKKCKLFDKTYSKADKKIKEKFNEFVKWKSQHPTEKFGSSDYPFNSSAALATFSHAKLTFDVSVVYRYEDGIIYLFGIFSHDESGTGQPQNKNRQVSLRSKLDNQVFN
jgi:hypothetical protein